MAYTINLTDGAIFATIPDGTIDASSSMILVGKNYAGYGEFLDENFIHLLENGANNVPPSAPLVGQLWWDKSTNTMKVYTGNTFKVISGATSSASAPTLSNVPGDLWWDTVNGQLKVWNGASFTLIGPASSGPGVSGAIVTTITDNVAVPHVVVQLFVDNTIVGMISKDATFTPQTPIPGFAQIAPGIQLSTSVPNALFRGTALNANTLESLAASAFMRTGVNTSTSGTLGVLNDTGLTVGLDQDARISVTTATSEVIVDNQTSDANLSMRINRGGTSTTVMRALGNTGEVTFPATAGVSVTGNITVPGIVKSGANNSGNIGSSTNVFNTIFASEFQGTATLANNVSGTVAVANGGTGRNTLNIGAVLLGNGTGNVNFVSPGADGNVLTVSGGVWVSQAGGGGGGNVTSVSAAAGSPITVTGTTAPVVGINSISTNAVLLGNGTDQFKTVAPGTDGNVLTASGGIWVSQGGGVTSVSAAAGSPITVTGSTTPVIGITSPIPVANGGTGGSTFTSNAVLLGNGTDQFQAVAPGTDGNVLLAQSGSWVSSGTVVLTSGDQNIAGIKTFTGNVAASNVIVGGVGNFIGNSIGQFNNFSGSTAIYGGDVSGGEFRQLSFDVNGSRRMDINFVNSATAVNMMYANTVPSTNNAFTLGEGTTPRRWSEIFATNGTINTSDARLKTDVIDSPLGLSFIDKLRPVAYRWIVGQNVEDGYDEQVILDENGDVRQLVKIPRFRPVPGVRMHYGLISQEVKAALDQEAVEDFAGWVLGDKNDPDSEQSLRMSEFIAPMIQAIKELKTELDQTKARLAELESHLGDPES